jgi:hypothetical protein
VAGSHARRLTNAAGGSCELLCAVATFYGMPAGNGCRARLCVRRGCVKQSALAVIVGPIMGTLHATRAICLVTRGTPAVHPRYTRGPSVPAVQRKTWQMARVASSVYVCGTAHRYCGAAAVEPETRSEGAALRIPAGQSRLAALENDRLANAARRQPAAPGTCRHRVGKHQVQLWRKPSCAGLKCLRPAAGAASAIPTGEDCDRAWPPAAETLLPSAGRRGAVESSLDDGRRLQGTGRGACGLRCMPGVRHMPGGAGRLL